MKRDYIVTIVILVLLVGSGMIGWFLRDYSMKLSPRSIGVMSADYIVTPDNAKTTITQAIHQVKGQDKKVIILKGDYGLSTPDFDDLNAIAVANNVTLIWVMGDSGDNLLVKDKENGK